MVRKLAGLSTIGVAVPIWRRCPLLFRHRAAYLAVSQVEAMSR